MFQLMYNSINQEIGELMFKLQPMTQERRHKGVFSSLPQKMIHDEASGMIDVAARMSQSQSSPHPEAPSAPTPIRKDAPKVGRNDPCPCGSGKKYKKCCG